MWHDEPVRWRWAQTTILTALTLLVGGQTFGPETSTGLLAGVPAVHPVSQLLGWYSIQVPAYSAALLTR